MAVLAAIVLAHFPEPAALAQEQPAQPAAAAPAATGKAAPRLSAQERKFAEKLALTDAQQSELAEILARQRLEVRKIWRQQNIAPEYRASAVRAISDRTHDEIRAILNDEQKKKFPAQHTAESPSVQGSYLDQWLNGPVK